MAFFTRVNLNVPVLPPEDLGIDGTCPTASHTHRRYASEPVSNVHGVINSTMRPNSIPGGSGSSVTRNSSGVADRNASGIVITNVNENEIPTKNTDKLVNAKGRPPAAESNARNSENGESEVLSKSTEKSEDNGEPTKRYEYVVDRVLGVEV